MRSEHIKTVEDLLDALEGCGDAGIEVVVRGDGCEAPCKLTLYRVPGEDLANLRETIRFECEEVRAKT